MDNTTRRLMMGAAGAVSPTYIEDVFSTWLYTGNGSTQTITNGIDLSGKSGMVWMKSRSGAGSNYTVFNDGGTLKDIYTDGTTGAGTATWTSWNNNGFYLSGVVNSNATTYASWTFRKQAKFFDVVTWTGNGSTGRVINHSLASTPGVVIVKRTDSTGDWRVFYPAVNAAVEPNKGLYLNDTSAQFDTFGFSAYSSTSLTVSNTNANQVNANGATYVAYLFAHDAGGFGDSGSDSVIKCGSYTGNGSSTGPVIDLGWEPQWLLIKRTDNANSWFMFDVMRNMSLANASYLLANLSSAESTTSEPWPIPTPTGFTFTTTNSNFNASGGTYIYIAIRRGPMKTPTDATKVFSAATRTGTSATAQLSTTTIPEAFLTKSRTTTAWWQIYDKLRGPTKSLYTNDTYFETTTAGGVTSFNQSSVSIGSDGDMNSNGISYVSYFFRRAPGFFDVVAYTGVSSSSQEIKHNLGVPPELIILRSRTIADSWLVYSSARGRNKYLYLNTTNAEGTQSNGWGSTDPTATAFYINNNALGTTTSSIAYLFGTVSGVSKVGTYTGTGNTLQINCGFTAGAKFVLIKRVDSTGGWYVWDTARGIVSGNDPFLLLNSSAAEDTSTDWIDPYSAGFEISSTAPAAINANGGSFIFLAVS